MIPFSFTFLSFLRQYHALFLVPLYSNFMHSFFDLFITYQDPQVLAVFVPRIETLYISVWCSDLLEWDLNHQLKATYLISFCPMLTRDNVNWTLVNVTYRSLKDIFMAYAPDNLIIVLISYNPIEESWNCRFSRMAG